MQPTEELKSLLSHHLSQTPYNPDDTSESRWLVDHLVEQVIDWEIGTTNTNKLRAIFSTHKSALGSFDILEWLQSKHEEGEYADPLTDTRPDD